jgi:hypothetical protein
MALKRVLYNCSGRVSNGLMRGEILAGERSFRLLSHLELIPEDGIREMNTRGVTRVLPNFRELSEEEL